MDTSAQAGRETPRFESDGFRDETCGRCGETIGFARFTAREYVIGGSLETGFTKTYTLFHTERDGFTPPAWCTREGR